MMRNLQWRRPLIPVRRTLVLMTGVLVLAILTGCGGSHVAFNYPAEKMVYPAMGEEPPAIFVEFIRDLRPQSQRDGEGGLATTRFPSDENWEGSAAEAYYQALVQDLTQTDLVQVVPLRSQADYVLEVDLEHMGCKVSRNAAGFVVTAAAGAGLGYIVGQSGGAAAAGAVIGAVAIPVPTRLRAVCQVRLRVFAAEREPFFEEACLGEITKSVWDGMLTRRDQQWVDENLTVAVKRCNACLLGQLRQALYEAANLDEEP